METHTAYKHGLLFGNEPVSESERARVLNEIEKVGTLTFSITSDEHGWAAQCNEVPAIIAGNSTTHPSDEEITSEIRSAIFAAFDVQIEAARTVESPYQEFRYAIVAE